MEDNRFNHTQWSNHRLKYLSSILMSNVDKKSFEEEIPVKLCNYVDVYYNEKITNQIDFMLATASRQEIERFRLSIEDVIITKDSESADDIGNPAIISEEIENLVCGYHLALLKWKKNIAGKFLFWYLKSKWASSYFEERANGITRFAIGLNTIGSLPIIFPEIATQQKIACFLDNETFRVDTLIAKKERQIELLQEKRQAIITHAVTKGIDPNAKMKDSGVEWIGEIPGGWEVKKIRFLFSFGRGLGISKSDLKDNGIPCISYGEIHSKFGFEVIPERNELKCVDEDYLKTAASSLIYSGDFVFADTSEDIEGSGNFSYLNSNETTFAGYHTVIMRPKTDMNSRYIAYFFDSPPHRGKIQQRVNGVKVYSITQSILKDVSVILPPMEEQDSISHYLDLECNKIDMITEKIHQTIDLLKEYRSSLVTHAVTGQIDVEKMEKVK